MGWKSMVSYKHLIGCTLKRTDTDGEIIDTLITDYELDYDDLFRQTDGHAGSMIHTLKFADETSYTFSNFNSVISKYGDPVK